MEKNRLLAVLSVFILIFTAVAVVRADPSISKGMSEKKVCPGREGRSVGVQLVDHEVIRINGDSGFNDSWPGDGSVNNPYIIENYNIDADGKPNAIYIGNTTVHFVVDNCHLHDAENLTNWAGYPYRSGGGICLYNVSHGAISDCQIDQNQQQGIFSSKSSDIELTGNDLTGNNYGIQIQSTDHLVITDNYIHSDIQGISLQRSQGQTQIKNNTIYKSGIGVSIQEASNPRVIGNSATGNDIGFYLYNQTIFRDNTVNNNSGMGVFIRAEQNTLFHNNISDNYRGLSLLNSSNDNEIYENNLLNNVMAFHMHNTTDNQIYHNNINETELSYATGSNVWDKGYPDGGNYWAGYQGEDQYYGSQQDKLGMDGIGDTNRSLEGGSNSDRYPLTHRFVWWAEIPPSIELDTPETEGSINPGTTINFDIWDGNRDLESAEYSIDGTSFKSFQIDYRLDTSSWGSGTHFVEIQARDSYGHSVTKTFDFYVDNEVPSLTILSPKEGSYLNRSKADISWTATDNDTSIDHYEIRMDDGLWQKTELSTNYNFTGLSRGNHTVEVKAVDIANNTAVKQVKFMVDNLDPNIQITSPFNDKKLNTSSVQIEWDADDSHSGIGHFEMKKDDGAWSSLGTVTQHTWTSLADGSHTIYVRAVDNAGNTDTDQVSFQVDATPPDLSITDPSSYESVSAASVTVEWTVNDSGSGMDQLEIRLDDGYWKQLGIKERAHTFESLSKGDHTVVLRAMDGLGNTRTRSVNFTVQTGEGDNTAPDLIIKSPQDDSYLSDPVMDVEWTANDEKSGISHYEIKLDDAAWLYLGGQTNHTFTGLSDGNHTVSVRAHDVAGNERTKSVDIEIDTKNPDETDPSIQITKPEEGTEITGGSFEVTWDGSDGDSGVHHYEIKLDNGSWNSVGRGESHTFKNVTTGDHRISVKVVDRAGNQDEVEVRFRVIEEGESEGLAEAIEDNMLLIIALLLVIAAIIVLFLFLRRGGSSSPSEEPSDEEGMDDLKSGSTYRGR